MKFTKYETCAFRSFSKQQVFPLVGEPEIQKLEKSGRKVAEF